MGVVGDPTAVDWAVVERLIRRYLAQWVTDTDELDDIAQDCLVKVWRGYGSFEGKSRLTSWLYRIARNEFLTSKRSGGRNEAAVRGAWGAGVARSPEDRVIARVTVGRWMCDLAEHHRGVIESLYFLGMTSAEAGRRLGVADSTVRCWHRQSLARSGPPKTVGAIGSQDQTVPWRCE